MSANSQSSQGPGAPRIGSEASLIRRERTPFHGAQVTTRDSTLTDVDVQLSNGALFGACLLIPSSVTLPAGPTRHTGRSRAVFQPRSHRRRALLACCEGASHTNLDPEFLARYVRASDRSNYH